MGVEGEEKKKLNLDPKAIGLIAFLVIGGGIAVVMNTGLLSGGGGDDDDSMPTPSNGGGSSQPAQQDPAPPPSSGPSAGPSFTASAVPPPAPLPYTTVVPPNPRYQTGTLGILPSNPSLTGIQAAGLARYARDQYQRSGKWKSLQIVVFSDSNTARLFADYQARKRGSPLAPGDYRQLANADIWRNASAYYQSTGKKERIDYPSKNPYNWWQNNS